MWTLTGFADEISPDLDEQVATLATEDMHCLEFRSVWNKNVTELSDAELKRVKTTLSRSTISVSSIGSPIGKIDITDDFTEHLAAFRRTVEIAQILDTRYIRIFSFFIPAGDDPSTHRDEVMDRLKRIVQEVDGTPITLLHENEKHIYGDIPSRCLDILTQVDSPRLRMAWDPANFVQCGVNPYTDGYEMLRPFIDYVHVKDARLGDGQVVPAGQGDGEIRRTVRALQESGFDGFFSLEPHLARAGTFSGFSGPDLFRLAVQSFKTLLEEEQIAWR